MKEALRKTLRRLADWVDPPVVEAVEIPQPTPMAPTVLLRPPIILRRYEKSDEAEMESNNQFINYGWCKGVDSTSLSQVYAALSKSMLPNRAQVVIAYRIGIANRRYFVRAQSTVQELGIEYAGPRLVFLYMPGDEELPDGTFPTCPIFGGPTDGAMRVIREIGLSLNLRVAVMEHDTKNGLLIAFNTLDHRMQLDELFKTWTP